LLAFRLILIFITLAFVVIIFFLNFSFSYYYDSSFRKKPTLVLINKGLTLAEITSILQKEEILKYPQLFSYILRLKNLEKKIKAGEYFFPANISPQKVFNILNQGKTYMRSITIIEGQTVDEIINKIEMTNGLEGNIIDFPKEGEVLPDTYFFSWGEKKQKILDLMKNSMKEMLNNEWAKRAPEIEITNMRDAVILASIIEKETSLDDEKQLYHLFFIID